MGVFHYRISFFTRGYFPLSSGLGDTQKKAKWYHYAMLATLINIISRGRRFGVSLLGFLVFQIHKPMVLGFDISNA